MRFESCVFFAFLIDKKIGGLSVVAMGTDPNVSCIIK